MYDKSDIQGASQSGIPSAWAIGTKLYFVPIRFWEVAAPETGSVAEHANFAGELLPNPTHDGFVYAFHDLFGHNVYMRQADTFLTADEALAEMQRRNTEKEQEEARELDSVMARIKAHKALGQ